MCGEVKRLGNTMFKLSTLSICVASAAATVAVAETTNSKMEEVVVSASRIEMPAARVGSSVTVITSAQIEDKGVHSIAEVLRFSPGVAVSNSGGVGKQTSLRVRGEESYRTLVLVDGVDISDPTATQVTARLGHQLAQQLDRIEVLRGPQGMIYGADAGGVVNVYSKSAKAGETFAGGLALEAGRYNTQSMSANVRGSQDFFDYSLTAVDLSTDGFNVKSVDKSLKDDDGYDNTTINAKFGFNLSDKIRVQVFLRDLTTDNMIDGWSEASNHDLTSELDQFIANIQLSYSGEVFTHKLSYSDQSVEREDFTSGVRTYATEGEVKQAQYLGSAQVSQVGRLIYGIDYDDQEDTLNDYSENQLGVFVEWQGQIGDSFFYTAGLRNDDNDSFGEYNTYRATAAYLQQLDSGTLKYKASTGTGFRAPSLYELYNPTYGNEDLGVEESDGFDVGIEYYNSQGYYAELVYFDQEVVDAIDWSWTTALYEQEKGKSKSKGIEALVEIPVTQSINLITNYMYNDAYKQDGSRRDRRPRHVAALGLKGSFLSERLVTNIEARGSYDSVDRGVELDDYEVVNVKVSYQVSEEVKLFVRGENIFNEKYEEIGGYNVSGAALYAGVNFDF